VKLLLLLLILEMSSFEIKSPPCYRITRLYPDFRIQDSGVSIRTPAKTFEDLIVWQKSHQFVLAIYELTNKLPKSEAFGLISQIRRAAISIPANIAEGFYPFSILASEF
jgi:hypothetical protein